MKESFATTQREFARFLTISIKSVTEVEYQLQLARDYGLMPDPVWLTLTRDAIEVRRMLETRRSRNSPLDTLVEALKR